MVPFSQRPPLHLPSGAPIGASSSVRRTAPQPNLPHAPARSTTSGAESNSESSSSSRDSYTAADGRHFHHEMVRYRNLYSEATKEAGWLKKENKDQAIALVAANIDLTEARANLAES